MEGWSQFKKIIIGVLALPLLSAHATLQTDGHREAVAHSVGLDSQMAVESTFNSVQMKANGEKAAQQLALRLIELGLTKQKPARPVAIQIHSSFDVRDHKLLKVLIQIAMNRVITVLERFDENGSLYSIEIPEYLNTFKRTNISWDRVPEAQKDKLQQSGEYLASAFVKSVTEQKGQNSAVLKNPMKIPMSRFNPSAPGVLDVLVLGQKTFGSGREVEFINMVNVVFAESGELRSLSIVAM